MTIAQVRRSFVGFFVSFIVFIAIYFSMKDTFNDSVIVYILWLLLIIINGTALIFTLFILLFYKDKKTKRLKA